MAAGAPGEYTDGSSIERTAVSARALVVSLACLFAVVVAVTAGSPQADPLLDRARALHRAVPMFDGHNDYPWEVRTQAGKLVANLDIRAAQPKTMTDIPRLRQGGVGAQFPLVAGPFLVSGDESETHAA